MPRTYLFDLDGTLIDSLPGIAEALTQAFTSIGRVFPKANLRSTIGPPIRTIAQRLDPTLTEAQTLQIEAIYRPLYDQQTWRQTTLYPGVAETLETLATQGHQLHILTNKPRIPTEKVLNHLGISHLFATVLTRDSGYPSKAAMLAHLIALHHLTPPTTLMVGDTPEDAEAAQACQIPFLFVNYGYGQAPPGVQTIDHFKDLLTH